jgi:hypothetical protein
MPTVTPLKARRPLFDVLKSPIRSTASGSSVPNLGEVYAARSAEEKSHRLCSFRGMIPDDRAQRRKNKRFLAAYQGQGRCSGLNLTVSDDDVFLIVHRDEENALNHHPKNFTTLAEVDAFLLGFDHGHDLKMKLKRYSVE